LFFTLFPDIGADGILDNTIKLIVILFVMPIMVYARVLKKIAKLPVIEQGQRYLII
jgi:hypothetical protein